MSEITSLMHLYPYYTPSNLRLFTSAFMTPIKFYNYNITIFVFLRKHLLIFIYFNSRFHLTSQYTHLQMQCVQAANIFLSFRNFAHPQTDRLSQLSLRFRVLYSTQEGYRRRLTYILDYFHTVHACFISRFSLLMSAASRFSVSPISYKVLLILVMLTG